MSGCKGKRCDGTGDPSGCTAHFCYSGYHSLSAHHALHWWRTETLIHVRWARRPGVTAEMRRWHIGQAATARGYVRELQRRHPGVAPCDCLFPKMDPDFRPDVYPPFPPQQETATAR